MKKLRKRVSAAVTAAVTALSCLAVLPQVQKAEPVQAADALLAFPGAVGAGRYATGGRGGEVYHVTNLNDSGEGSFRDAVSKSGRIVVFDVSGTIELKGNILCQSNITIAGQTAPGGAGITLKNYKMGMSGDNIICRYISSRPGPYASTSSGNDAWGGAKGSNSIIDHCSMGWTTDEQWGLYSANQYYTVQYSVLGPADSWGGHAKGLHGFGIMMGKGYLTFDHNLIIHNVSRNFRGKVEGQQTADFTNNIIYDWGYQTAYGTIGHLNYVNNTLKAGNSTTGGYHWMYVDSGTKPENFKVYCAGNQLINKDGSLHAITYDNWSGVTLKEAIGITMNDLHSDSPFATTVNGVNVSTATTCESAADSYDHVISFAGNGIAPDKRTAIDQQCANETRTGTGSCSGTAAYDSSQTNLDKYAIKCGVTYTYPSAVLQKTITDADNDGMDDDWELARGLDPSDPTDTNGDYLGDGYTNIEYYINDLTVDSFPEGVVTPSPETGSVPGRSAFERIEAEDLSTQSGIITETANDPVNIGYVEAGDYAMYKRIDFEDGANSVTFNASGNACGIEIYLDRMDKPAATVAYPGTGSFGKYEEISVNIPPITGQHNVYLKFTGGEGYLLNLDWFVFSKDRIPMSGKLIEDVQIYDQSTMSAWKIAYDAAVGSPVFCDRDFTFRTLPAEVVGAEQLLTACDSKNYAGADLTSFTAAEDIDVYVLLDQRVDPVPAWLQGFEKTAMTAETSNDVMMDLYRTTVAKGSEVTFGAQAQSYNCINYTILAMPAAAAETTTEATTTTTVDTTTTEAATTTVPETTTTVTVPTDPDDIDYGNVDDNDTVDIMDVIAINKSLLGSLTLSETGRRNADVDNNGSIDTTDALNILKAVVKLVTLPVAQ